MYLALDVEEAADCVRGGGGGARLGPAVDEPPLLSENTLCLRWESLFLVHDLLNSNKLQFNSYFHSAVNLASKVYRYLRAQYPAPECWF